MALEHPNFVFQVEIVYLGVVLIPLGIVKLLVNVVLVASAHARERPSQMKFHAGTLFFRISISLELHAKRTACIS